MTECGAAPGAAQAVVLAAPDVHAHNTFAEPRHVQPRPQKVEAPRDGMLVHEFPPASVTRITMNLVQGGVYARPSRRAYMHAVRSASRDPRS